MSVPTVSKQTQKNWWVDAALASAGITAAISGVYFLFLPSGGFQGGRNPYYNIQVLFSRSTWDDVHTWSGVAMISIALVHLVIHWSWVTNMARRTVKELRGQCACMNWRGRWNLALNAIVALGFLLCALSGVYFLFVPGGRWETDPMFLFPRSTWDLIHTWSGVAFISAAIIHFVIHWRWVSKVTIKMAGMVSATGQPSALSH